MKPNLKVLVAVLALGLAAYTAYAENVTISTYYPSPYGSYTTLEAGTIQGTGGAANVSMVPNGAWAVNVGTATAAVANGIKLNVQAGYISTFDTIGNEVAYMEGTGTNAFLGARGSGAANFGNSEGFSTLIADGGNVGIGTAPGAFKLNVNGSANVNGNITLANAGNKLSLQTNSSGAGNELQVNCAGGTGCYAYAVYS